MENKKIEENRARRMLGLAHYMEKEAPRYGIDPAEAFLTGFLSGIEHSLEYTDLEKQYTEILRWIGPQFKDILCEKSCTPAEYMRAFRFTARKIPKTLLLLWEAELSIGMNGEEIDPILRLEEIKNIYGRDSRPYWHALETSEWLALQKDRRRDHVLLVIDLQDAFRKAPYFDSVSQFIRLARPYYDLVCGTFFCNREETDPGYREALGWDGCSGEEAELRKTVHYDPDVLFSKHGYGMPERMLKWLDPEVEYDIVGCDLDACVLAVCFQLWDRGIRFHILSEYVYTGFSSGFTHENVRMIMRKNFGDRYCRNTANLFKNRGWKLCRKKRRKMVQESRDRESVSERKEKI